MVELPEIFHLCAKKKVAKLGKGEENDEEHHRETSQVLGTAAESRAELGHGLIEADVFEDLQRSRRS